MAKLWKSQKSARDKVMDYLARRNHSELELRRKLNRYFKDEPENLQKIDAAIEFAKTSGWMPPPEVLSGELTRQLGRRKKSHRYIEQALRSKGLPPAPKDLEAEIKKAQQLIDSKLAKDPPFDYEQKKKIHRLLSNRGFDLDTIKKVMNAPSKDSSHD